jgi:hypothetical protein
VGLSSLASGPEASGQAMAGAQRVSWSICPPVLGVWERGKDRLPSTSPHSLRVFQKGVAGTAQHTRFPPPRFESSTLDPGFVVR